MSVIIPVYNASRFIKKSVESAVGLDEVGEVILVDDGSNDGSYEIGIELSKQYSKVKLFIHDNHENKGVSESRSVGMENSVNDFISFLDADDYYLPNRFVKTKVVFDNEPKAVGVYEAVGTHFYSEESKIKFYNNYPSEITTVSRKVSPDDLFYCLVVEKDFGSIHLDGLTLKRSLIQNFRFDSKLRQCQDTDFIFRLCNLGKLYPGEIIQAISMRGVHDSNRVIYNEVEKNIAKGIFYSKWLGIIIENSYHQDINKSFIIDYVTRKNYVNSDLFLRIKFYFKIIQLFIFKPILIKKIYFDQKI